MKKCIVSLLLIVFLLSGCGIEKDFSGEVIAMNPESKTFTLRSSEGHEKAFAYQDDTFIFAWRDSADHENFLSGEYEGLQATVTTDWSGITRISLDGLLTRNALTLSDSTSVDTLDTMSFISYRLSDGTELLHIQHPSGPENVHSGNTVSLDALPETAQQNIKDYYDAQGLLYDAVAELENAYAYYNLVGREDFQSGMIHQDVAPVACSEKVVYYLTDYSIPSHGKAAYDFMNRLGAAFDRETGEPIGAWELFNCSRADAIQRILDLSAMEDAELRAAIEANLQPENMVFLPEGLEIFFPCGVLDEGNTTFGMYCPYKDGLDEILHSWAVPQTETD